VTSPRSWVVFGFAVFSYISAVLQRTTLGVAGVDATERFDVSATALSTLTVLQLVVYAALQVPIGVLLDRVGPKRVLITGAVLMAVGQATLALAPGIGIAVLGRVLVGGGDALTFISVMRLLPAWFGGRALPQVSQWLGTLGQTGQLLSAVPFSMLLHSAGWEQAFLAAAGFSVLSLLCLLIFVSNGASDAGRADPPSWGLAMHRLRESLARPGTQLGFWAHYVTQSSQTTLMLLWGFPFLAVGLGYGAAAASALLVLVVVGGIMIGPVLGLLSARFPFRRSNLVLGIVAAMGAAWTAVLAWPGIPPTWLVIVLLLVVAAGGPGSLIGFDFARTFNPMRSLGSASGIVNVGGFLASFVIMFLVGVVLDLLDRAAGGTGQPSELYGFDRFRIAFLVQFLVVGIGVVFVVRSRRRTRRLLQREEGITVGPLWVALMRRWRRR
jgi:sugar phosphate permease